jgi:hypothetical protein
MVSTMKTCLSLTVLAWGLMASLLAFAADSTLQQQYLEMYSKLNEAEHLEASGNTPGALGDYAECYSGLKKIAESNPNWEPALVIKRLEDLKSKIAKLKASEPNAAAPASSSDESVSPLASLLKTATIPWKVNISVTLFWIGENPGNAWDPDWTKHNNGSDAPDARKGYLPKHHLALLNPFYVALPFNDLAFPDKAREWLPAGWHNSASDEKHLSACKDRWIEMKNKQGQRCFAQWEDVGPERTDHAEYVFGDERPSPGKPGLCISPAVAFCLNLNTDNPKIVSWRFVDAADVAPGPWLKYNEQAILNMAMQQKASDPSPSPASTK